MRVITLDANNKVIETKEVKKGYISTGNEIISESGECGQIRQLDGTFVTPVETISTEPSIEDKVNFLYYKATGVIS